jgi:spheroidene monooxygenase
MIAVIGLVDIKSSEKLWGFARFVIGRFWMRNIPGLRFFKILGSGDQGGFGLKPSPTHQGLFCLFDRAEHAKDFLKRSSVVNQLRERSRECFSAILTPYSSRGQWSGVELPVATQETPTQGPIAALTRASIKISKASAFWKNSPPAEEALSHAKGCLLAAGLGEAPLLRQATFTIWESSDAMDAYARSGAHLQAIQASYAGGHFSESMFVRFVPSQMTGIWKGQHFG